MLPNTLIHVEWLETIDRLSMKISVPGVVAVSSSLQSQGQHLGLVLTESSQF